MLTKLQKRNIKFFLKTIEIREAARDLEMLENDVKYLYCRDIFHIPSYQVRKTLHLLVMDAEERIRENLN